MLDLVRWYVVISLIGLAALPLTARAFRNLPDRGYAFARPVGLLAVAALLWFGSLFGLWTNSSAIVAVLTVALALAGWLGLRSAVSDIRALWRDQRSHVYVVEWVFLVALLFWAFCRSYFPAIEATEKPMEYAFLNGIMRSPSFPPVDPWLSGNSISYYYLGYVLVAAVTELSAVPPAVAFNLAIATLFALTVVGAFAVGYYLVDGLNRTRAVASGQSTGAEPTHAMTQGAWLGGGIAALFVALLGNWEGLLEMLHAHGIGSVAFWQSLAIWHLNQPYISQQWYPTDAQDNWWWFRATRVILDYPSGTPPPDGYNTITEFPFFSFLLGDLHPHVLALPFAFVCIAFALNFLRSPGDFRLTDWRSNAFDLGFIVFLYGAMFLLNAWDILTYLFVLICAFAVRQYIARPSFDFAWLRSAVVFGAVSLVGGLLLYWPFYVTFRSQASGLLGIVQLHSHLEYFVIFWGPYLFLVGSLVVAELIGGISPLPRNAMSAAGPAWTRGPTLWIGVAILAAVAIAAQAPALALVIPVGVTALVLTLRYLSGSTSSAAVEFAVSPKWEGTSTATVAADDERSVPVAGGAVPASWASDHVFVFVLLLVAMLLLFGTEVVFIQDSFNSRMNTVFKLYYQSWEMLALVSAYTVYYLGSGAFGRVTSAARAALPSVRSALPRPVAIVWLVVVAVFVAAAFIYVPASLESRSNGFSGEPTLDGLSYYQQYQPDDAAGIAWLEHNVSGTPTILEATGGSYSEFGEVAWMTGLPTILGWDFHEIQWRGASIVPVENERKHDIDTLYTTTDPRVAQDLLKKYGVTYVYVGPLERQVYGKNGDGGLTKFAQFMDIVYKNPGVVIYIVRGGS